MNFFAILLIFFLFIGCYSDYNNLQETEPAFQIKLAPSFAPQATQSMPVNAQILLQVSTPLRSETVNEQTVLITDQEQQPFPAYVKLRDQMIIVQPKVYLSPLTAYSITITTIVATLDGKHLLQNKTIDFQSGDAFPDTTPPNYVGTNIDGTALQKENIFFFQFSEPLSPLSIEEGMVTLQNKDTTQMISGSTSISGSLLIFEPDEPLLTMEESGNDVGYNVVLQIDHRLSDLAGNKMSPIQYNYNIGSVNANLFTTVTKDLNPNNYNLSSTVFTIIYDNGILYIGHEKGLEILTFDLTSKIFSFINHLDYSEVGSVYSVKYNASLHRLYLGSSKGFYIVNATSLNQLTVLSNYTTASPVYNFVLESDHAYLAASLQGLIDLNISNETTLTERYIKDTNGAAFDIYVGPNSYDPIYIADYNGAIKSFLKDGSPSMDVAMLGHARNFVYNPSNSQLLLAAGIGGIRSLEILSTPYFTTTLDMPSYVTKLFRTKDAITYANLYKKGIFEFDSSDVTNKAKQRLIQTTPSIDIITFTYGYSYLFLADRFGHIYSITVP